MYGVSMSKAKLFIKSESVKGIIHVWLLSSSVPLCRGQSLTASETNMFLIQLVK
jgi:hypothetical protein